MKAREVLLTGLTKDEVNVVFHLLDAAGIMIVPKEPTEAMRLSIVDEIEAQEIDPMEWDRKARCIWRTALHSAETGQRGYTTEEASAMIAASQEPKSK